MNQFPGGYNPYAAAAGGPQPGQGAFPAVNRLAALAGQAGTQRPALTLPGGIPFQHVARPGVPSMQAQMAPMAQRPQLTLPGGIPFQHVARPGSPYGSPYGLAAGGAPGAGMAAQGPVGQFAPAGAGGAMPPSPEMLARARAMQAAGANMNAAAGAAGPPQGQQMAMALSDRRAKRVLSLREILGR